MNLISAAKTENKKHEVIRSVMGYIFFNFLFSFLQFSFNYVNKNNEFFQSNFLNKTLISFIALFFFNLESKELAKFNDWSAFAEGEGKILHVWQFLSQKI